MPADTPAADRLAAKIKAARSIGTWGIELTTQEADTLLAEIARLREQETPEPCGAMGPPSLCGDEGRPLGPCVLGPGHRNAYHREPRGWWLGDDTKESK